AERATRIRGRCSDVRTRWLGEELDGRGLSWMEGVAMSAITQCCRRSFACVGVVAAVAVLTAAVPAGAASYGNVRAAAAGGFPPSPYTFLGLTSQWQCTMNTGDPFCGTINLQMAKDMRH